MRSAIILFALLWTLFALPSPAQYGQGMFDGEVLSVARRSGQAISEWYRQHGTLPNSDSDIDACLRYVYEQVTGTAADASTRIEYSGNVHALGKIRISIDPTVRDASLSQWRSNPPQNWWAPAMTTNILLDGENTYLIWSAVINNAPMRDENNQAIILYRNLAVEGPR